MIIHVYCPRGKYSHAVCLPELNIKSQEAMKCTLILMYIYNHSTVKGSTAHAYNYVIGSEKTCHVVE